jgi:hypothetical protein
MENKIYFNIPFILKETAKKLGSKFDKEQKSWYINDETLSYKFDKVFLDVPFDEKDNCKSKGGIWDKVQKKWYTPAFNTDLIKLYTEHESNRMIFPNF